jgi:hypothetical protein
LPDSCRHVAEMLPECCQLLAN